MQIQKRVQSGVLLVFNLLGSGRNLGQESEKRLLTDLIEMMMKRNKKPPSFVQRFNSLNKQNQLGREGRGRRESNGICYFTFEIQLDVIKFSFNRAKDRTRTEHGASV